MTSRTPSPRAARCSRGFTLVELMAAVFISILVIGTLYHVFNRVQVVFRIGNNQAQVLERGRALMDMMVRDLETMAPSGNPEVENLSVRDFGVEFWQAGMPFLKGNAVFHTLDRAYYLCQQTHTSGPTSAPGNAQYWTLIGPASYTTILENEKLMSGDFFFVGRDRDWHTYGYGLYSRDAARTPNPMVGALYRCHESSAQTNLLSVMASYRSRAYGAHYQKIADGVVHLRMRAISAYDIGKALWHEPVLRGDRVPLFVELELALVEDSLAREIQAKGEEFTGTDADRYQEQLKLLMGGTERIHFFRQLVPIRNRYFR